MPIPKQVAHFNRRFTNRVTRRFAGRVPGFGIVRHVGRRSGRIYHTPVNVFRDGGEHVIALTYGSDSDWVRNVLAAGSCELRTRGRTIQLRSPRLFTDTSRRLVPPPARWLLAVFGVDEFLALTPV